MGALAIPKHSFRIAWFAAGLCFLFFLAPLAQAQDQARLPYQMIYQMEKTRADLSTKYTNVIMFLTMTPGVPGVTLSDVKVYIDSKSGPIPIPLDGDLGGKFTVPLNDALLAEKPWILVNQPKGTMSLGWFVGLRGAEPPTDGIHYRAMMRLLNDMVAIGKEMAKIPGTPPLKISGLRLIFPADKEATVTVHAKGGDRVFKTDATHSLTVPLEAALLEEDPAVSIPIRPLRIDPAKPLSGK